MQISEQHQSVTQEYRIFKDKEISDWESFYYAPHTGSSEEETQRRNKHRDHTYGCITHHSWIPE